MFIAQSPLGGSEVFNKRFYIFWLVSFIFYFPILFGSPYHADDVSRAISGMYGWGGLGRYLADYVAVAYSLGNSKIIDPMPFGFILNTFFIGLSSYLVYTKLSRDYSDDSMVVPLLFLINPFFVENLLYRFDSTGMVLALFFAVLSFSIRSGGYSLFFKILLLVVSLNIYQTFSNVYIGLIALELIYLCQKKAGGRVFLKFAAHNALIFIAANFIYAIEFIYLGMNGRGDMISLDVNAPVVFINNIAGGMLPFYNFWSYSSAYILITLPFLAASLIWIIFKKEYLLLVAVLLSVALVALSSLGGAALLKAQFVQPRGLAYFPIVLMIATKIIMFLRCRFYLVVCVPVLACFIFVSRVGNIHAIQEDFEKPILAMATTDLYNLNRQGVDSFYSIGSLPLSRYVKNIISATPFNGLINRGGWNTTGRLHEYGNQYVKLEWSEQASKSKAYFIEKRDGMNLSIDRRPFYRIYTENNSGWILWGDDK